MSQPSESTCVPGQTCPAGDTCPAGQVCAPAQPIEFLYEVCASGCPQRVEFICQMCQATVCDDSSCHTQTVNGILCGTYTQWGCARKFTTCDMCCDGFAMHEGDMVFCEECNVIECPACAEDHACEQEEQPKSEQLDSN
jgi:hypothetical protein